MASGSDPPTPRRPGAARLIQPIAGSCSTVSRQLRPGRPDRRPDRVPARSHRRVRWCAHSRPGVRNRHLPLRLDPRRRTDALGNRSTPTRRRWSRHDHGGVRPLVSWYERPTQSGSITPRLHPTIFPITGLTSAAWPLLAFALGALGGLLWRRVVPALVTAFGLWFGLALLVGNVFRMKYSAPRTTASLDYQANSLTIDQWWTKGNARVTGEHSTRPSAGSTPRSSEREQRQGRPHTAAVATRSNTCWRTATRRSPATNPTAATGPSNGSSSAGSPP